MACCSAFAVSRSLFFCIIPLNICSLEGNETYNAVAIGYVFFIHFANHSHLHLGGEWEIGVADVRVSVEADGSFGVVRVEERWGRHFTYFGPLGRRFASFGPLGCIYC